MSKFSNYFGIAGPPLLFPTFPAPAPAPISFPAPAPAPAPISFTAPAPAPAPISFTAPAPAPLSFPAPFPAPAPAPLSFPAPAPAPLAFPTFPAPPLSFPAPAPAPAPLAFPTFPAPPPISFTAPAPISFTAPAPISFTAPAPAPAPIVFPPAQLFANEKIDEGHLMDVFQIPEIDNNLFDIIDPVLFTTQTERDSIALFIKTYSAYHIKNFTPAQKESLKQRLWHNQVLVTLIQNLDKPKFYKVDYLEGPISFTLFQFNNKTVYLFGEIHRNTIGHCLQDGKPAPAPSYSVAFPTNSLRFNDFLRELSIDTPSFFDFYLETDIDDFYKFYSTADPRPSIFFKHIFYLLYNGFENLTSYSFLDRYEGSKIIIELKNIANNFSTRNSLVVPVSTGIVPDQQLLDDIYNYYNSNRNINNRLNLDFPSYELCDIKNKHFSTCFQAHDSRKSNDSCRLGRYHNVDARGVLFNIQNQLDPLQFFIEISINQDSRNPNIGDGFFFLLKRIGVEAFFEKILEHSTGTSEENIFNHIINMYPQVKKEWNRSYFKEKIKDFIKNKIKNIDVKSDHFDPPNLIDIDTLTHDCLTMFQDPLATTTNKTSYTNTIDNMLRGFFVIGSYIMDIYCLSRIFKKFKNKTDCQPEKTYNIIVYTGDAHTRVYSEFIVSLGNAPLYQTQNTNYSCIDIGFNSVRNPISNLNIG